MRQNGSSVTSATQLSGICDFTLASYRELLRKLQSTHQFATFAQFDGAAKGNRPIALLRHDIDYTIEDALTMARFEAELGVSATYFLLFSSPTYNLLAPGNISAPRTIRELGHEVGLHYDVGAIMEAGGDPQQVLRAQARLLGELSGAHVASIAMHNPSLGGEDLFREAAYNNAYAPRFCKSYYSDSCMAWRDNFVAAYCKRAFEGDLQLLIHPCLWTERKLSRRQKLQRIYSKVEEGIRAQQRASQAIWTNHSGAAEHDAREGALTVLRGKAAG